MLKASKTPVTLKNIAERAGVSRPVVSKVLLGASGNTRVSDETAEKIRKIASDMGYLTNHVARQLAGKRSKTIGVVIDSFAPKIFFHWLSEMERVAASKGYMFIVGQSHGEVDRLREYADNFSGRGVEGVICLSHDYGATGEMVAGMFSRVRNVVFIGKPAGDADGLCYVAFDFVDAIHRIVEHLHASGRKRIGLLLADDDDKVQAQLARRRGYERGLASLGMDYDPSLLQHFSVSNSGEICDQAVSQGVESLVREGKADAIIANNDIVAVKIIRKLRSMGLQVPTDVAVAGFDNHEMSADVSPSLTTVELPGQEIAQQAVSLLLDQIEGRTIQSDKKQVMLQTKLIIREST